MSATGRGGVRQPDDFYVTPGFCVRRLLEAWQPRPGKLVEPSAGNGAIIRAAEAVGVGVGRWLACEIREEERPALDALCTTIIGDFLVDKPINVPADSVTAVVGNPPFSLAWEFVQTARRRFPRADVCFLLRVAFAASEKRNAFMRAHPPDLYVLPNRPSFTGKGTDSADYGWYLWPAESRAARFQVLKTTPLAERKQDCGHDVMIESAQTELTA